MQRLVTSIREFFVQTPAQPQQLPLRELDSTELQQVSGGLPKGGWGEDPASATLSASDSTSLPKGGW
jgi:hypothetical protein